MTSQQKRRSHKEMRADSDRLIIQAAISLFAERGYQKTTLIQIGERAGFTGTLISNRYGSKQGLLDVVLDHILSRFEDRWADMQLILSGDKAEEDHSAIAILSSFTEMYLQDVIEQEERIRALYALLGEAMGDFPELQSGMKKVNHVFRSHIEQIIHYGVSRGDLRSTLDVRVTAVLIVGILRGVAMQLLTEPEKVQLSDVIPAVQRAIVSTVGAY